MVASRCARYLGHLISNKHCKVWFDCMLHVRIWFNEVFCCANMFSVNALQSFFQGDASVLHDVWTPTGWSLWFRVEEEARGNKRFISLVSELKHILGVHPLLIVQFAGFMLSHR